MKNVLQNLSDTLVAAALRETGVAQSTAAGRRHEPASEILEEIFIEAAFAEAADYDDIREAILREHRPERNIAHPGGCQYGDDDLCFT